MSERFVVSCTDCPFVGRYVSAAQGDYAFSRHSCTRQAALVERRKRVRSRRTLAGQSRECVHKVANHIHGTRAAYVLDKCRCRPCTDATAQAERNRTKQIAYGRWEPYVEAVAAEEHVEMLRSHGIGLKRIAVVSGVPHGSLSKLIYGNPRRGQAPSRRIRPDTARRILAVDAGLATCAQRHPCDGLGTRRRIQALCARGWSIAQIGRHAGITAIHRVASDDSDLRASTVRAVAAVYDELWNVDPPQRNQTERIVASRSRRSAAERGWLPPLAWDDIDDPNEHPFDGCFVEQIDEVAVERITRAEAPVHTTRAERIEAIRRLAAQGLSASQISRRVGLSANTVSVTCSRNGISTGPASHQLLVRAS